MKVDAVQERPGNFREIFFDLVAGTGAVMARVGEKTAAARVHRTSQQEPGRETQRFVRPGDGDFMIFQRLAQGLQDVTVEFGQFIEKQYAVVR